MATVKSIAGGLSAKVSMQPSGAALRVPYSGIGSVLGEEEIEAIRAALDQDDLCSGQFVGRFEKSFMGYTGAPHAIAVSNCTTALELATSALGLKEGDEVITTPLTFIATALPLLKRKVKIVFSDIRPDTLNIDPEQVAALVTSRTRAIYVVDYAGLPVDLDAILQIARERGLSVVEDAAHAPGAEYKGRKVGSISDITCFSFQSLKNMTTLGDGGMLTTLHAEIAERVRCLKSFGIRKLPERTTKYGRRKEIPPFYWDVVSYGDEIGLNYRMSEAEAAVGLVQLQRLDCMTHRRQQIARRISEGLESIPGLQVPVEPDGYKHVFHLYPLLIDEGVVGNKDAFMERMDTVEGVDLWTQYCPIYLHSVFREQGYRPGTCPVAERIFLGSLVNLPIYPRLSDEQVEHMIAAVRRSVEALQAHLQTSQEAPSVLAGN